MVFFQNTVHEVVPLARDKPQHRLFFGFRLTDRNEPHMEVKAVMLNQGVPLLPSGQRPAMWAGRIWGPVKTTEGLVKWSKHTFVPELLVTHTMMRTVKTPEEKKKAEEKKKSKKGSAKSKKGESKAESKKEAESKSKEFDGDAKEEKKKSKKKLGEIQERRVGKEEKKKKSKKGSSKAHKIPVQYTVVERCMRSLNEYQALNKDQFKLYPAYAPFELSILRPASEWHLPHYTPGHGFTSWSRTGFHDIEERNLTTHLSMGRGSHGRQESKGERKEEKQEAERKEHKEAKERAPHRPHPSRKRPKPNGSARKARRRRKRAARNVDVNDSALFNSTLSTRTAKKRNCKLRPWRSSSKPAPTRNA